MKWNFKLQEREARYTIIETAVAVRASEDLRGRETRPQIARRFGRPVKDDSDGAAFGLTLPSANRKVFERAGWVFVAPDAQVRRAAEERGAVADAEAVRQVVVSAAGELLVATDRVTAQLPEDLPEEEALRRLREDGLTPVARLRFAPNLFEARLPGGRPLPEVVSELQSRQGRYNFVSPELLQVIAGRMRPTDPQYPKQWHHRNDGSGGGTAGCDIRSEEAWELTRGAGPERPARVAVIDNGMQINHPDLVEGIKGGGFFGDDGQGGAPFFPFRPGMDGFPDKSHGTFCLGMAGARMNNGRGGCGSAPEADLFAIACLRDHVGTQATLARAVAYAADPSTEDADASPDDGADVISCSLGPRADWDISPELSLAISAAARGGRGGRGVPIFWAVTNGNFSVERDEVCSHPDVIAVGRSDHSDRENDTAYGPKLELLAPGVAVYSTRSGGQFGVATGTSYAAPLAAGVAALVLSRYPDLTAAEVRRRLRDTCDKVGGPNVEYVDGHHDEYGFGRVNAREAVQ